MSHSISRKKVCLKQVLLATGGLLVMLVLWSLLATRYHPLIFPSPLETATALKSLWKSGDLWANTAITLRRTLIGYLLAVIVGSMLALLLKTNSFCCHLFRPLVTIIQIIPPVIWLVLAVIWFGIADDLTPIFLIFIVTVPIIFLNIFSGLGSINTQLVEMAMVYRCSKKKIVFNVFLPALIQHFVSAISIGLAFAWKSTVFAEFIGSSSGIGYALSMANSNLETEKLFAWAVVLVLFMLFFEYGILQPVQRYATRWNCNEKEPITELRQYF